MTQPTARQILHAELMASEDPDSDVYADSDARINGLIDAHRDEVRREILGDDLDPSNLLLDARAFRYLADGIAATMANQNAWDGDDAEEAILLRYVQHLAKSRGQVLAEAADELERIADEVEAKVAEHYGSASGIGPSSADMVREAACTVRGLAARTAQTPQES